MKKYRVANEVQSDMKVPNVSEYNSFGKRNYYPAVRRGNPEHASTESDQRASRDADLAPG
jgi:hypothetical protein